MASSSFDPLYHVLKESNPDRYAIQFDYPATVWVFESPGLSGENGTMSVKVQGTDIYAYANGNLIEGRHLYDIPNMANATFRFRPDLTGQQVRPQYPYMFISLADETGNLVWTISHDSDDIYLLPMEWVEKFELITKSSTPPQTGKWMSNYMVHVHFHKLGILCFVNLAKILVAGIILHLSHQVWS